MSDRADVTDTLISVTRERIQMRVDACLEKHSGDVDAAVTGAGVGISFLLAREVVRALDHAEREIARLRARIGSSQ